MKKKPCSRARLSLLTAYRGKERLEHLINQLRWLERVRREEKFVDFELVLAEGDTVPVAREVASEYEWVQYIQVPMARLFHKSVLLNRAAKIAAGDFLIPFDVDLLPSRGVLKLHLELAMDSPRCLTAGYRVLLADSPSVGLPLATPEMLLAAMDVEDAGLLGPEDNPRALRKYLIDGQRFGVCPCYSKKIYEVLGGCDEQYIGRGPEDQDLIERACATGLQFFRSYDLLYFHMPHGKTDGWDDPALLVANRQRFAERRKQRQQ